MDYVSFGIVHVCLMIINYGDYTLVRVIGDVVPSDS